MIDHDFQLNLFILKLFDLALLQVLTFSPFLLILIYSDGFCIRGIFWSMTLIAVLTMQNTEVEWACLGK